MRPRAWIPTFRKPRVGLTFTRTLEYIDLRGAPWLIRISGETGEPESLASASSVSYKSSSQSSGSLAGIIYEIDEFVKINQRTKFEESNTHYSQVGFKDSLGDNWDVEFVTGNLQGYYGLQWGILVGPATSKTDLKRIVEKYLKRQEGEKVTSTKYGPGSVESFVTDASLDKKLEVPPEAMGKKPGEIKWYRTEAFGSVMVIGFLVGMSYVAYATWMKAS